MRKTVLAVAVAVLALAGCSKAAPDLKACEAAMSKQLAAGMASQAAGQTPATGTRPPECAGVSDKDLQDIAGRVMETAIGDQMSSAFPTP